MSGGSYNYLYNKDADEVFGAEDDLRHAVYRLDALADDAAEKVKDILAGIEDYRRSMNARLGEIAPVLQALEWWDSGDWGEDRFEDALEEFRKARP